MKHPHKKNNLACLAIQQKHLAGIIANPERSTLKGRKAATRMARDMANNILIACLIQGDDEDLVSECNVLHSLADQVNDLR